MSISCYTKFNTEIIEDENMLKNLLLTADDFSQHSKDLENSSTDDKVKKIFKANWVLFSQIKTIIENKLNPECSTDWEKFKVAISSDKEYNRIQAIAVFVPNFKYKQTKCSKLFSLATAYWNIPCEETMEIEYRVKGAGTSLVNFCSESGKQYGSNGEIFLNSLDPALGYYKIKLNFKECGERECGLRPDQGQTPMFLDSENAKTLNQLFTD